MQLSIGRRRRLTAIAVVLAALGCRAGGRGAESAPRPAQGGAARLLRVHPLNPRYFSDGTGKAVYLTGAHTWNNLQDVKTPIRGGFARYLDFLVAHHHNFIRFWMVEHAWDASDASFSAGPLPWPRSGSQPALDGKPRFDLHGFDASYFQRLRARAIEADRRAIYVSVMLFDDWSTENAGAWRGHPFHRANNMDGIDADANADDLGLEFHTLADAAIVALQESYVRHVIDTVGDLDNVMFEIANETGVSRDWQYHMVEVIRRHEALRPKRHLVGMTVGFPPLEVDDAALFASRADWISPSRDVVADGAKVIVLDSDHTGGHPMREPDVWKAFTHGAHPISMDTYEDEPELEPARRALGYARRFADAMDLARMAPHGHLADTGHCLAAPGSEYLVYQPDAGSSFGVELPAGRYRYEWFDADRGSVARSGTLSVHAGRHPFVPPFASASVLHLERLL